jgi:endogenous inhibitor of DNA gyrase (YacG/DUF329 family)
VTVRNPCPICRRAAAPREENPAFPFCRERCRLIDLGRWLGEEYRVPDDSPPPSPSASASEDDSSKHGEG